MLDQCVRMMGRHRNLVGRIVLTEISEAGSIEWLDHAFTGVNDAHDYAERGIQFLRRFGMDSDAYAGCRKDYTRQFPRKESRPTWDAAGKMSAGTIILMNAPVSDSSISPDGFTTILNTLRFLDRHGTVAKFVAFFITGAADSFRSDVLRIEESMRHLYSSTGLSDDPFARSRIFRCYLSGDGETVYNVSGDGEILYRDWYRR